MSYIGRTPTPAALTASDITDGIISTAKIADNAVTEPKTAWNDVPYRNIIINGDMSIAQRATSTSSVATNGYHACDRFRLAKGDSTVVATISQATDVPTGEGFFNSFKVDVTTEDASFVAADNILIQQKMEGQMLQHLKKGTANAESLTLSFWVKSTKTGTYIASLYDRDNSRLISKSYTVSVSDTWEEKSVTFAGDTTGALGNDNGASLDVWWWLGAGSTYTSGTLATSWESSTSANHAVGQVNSLDSTSNDFLITGIQLEVGTVASNFEFVPYDVNLKRCQRYYAVVADRRTSGVNPIRDQRSIGIGTTHYPDQVSVQLVFPTEMRSVPSLDQASGTDYYQYYHETTGDNFDDFNTIGGNGVSTMLVRNTDNISSAHGISGTVAATSDGNSYVALDAEL